VLTGGRITFSPESARLGRKVLLKKNGEPKGRGLGGRGRKTQLVVGKWKIKDGDARGLISTTEGKTIYKEQETNKGASGEKPSGAGVTQKVIKKKKKTRKTPPIPTSKKVKES